MTAAHPRTDTDLLIIGGGPAGCAAAMMANSLGMRSTLIEQDILCRKLHHIGAVNNVLGGFTTGPELAAAITADLRKAPLCRLQLGQHVSRIHAADDYVEVVLDMGERLTALRAVVATGVGPIRPEHVEWLTIPAGLRLPPLWEADLQQPGHRKLLVLGADRPLGTFLRANPTADMTVLVPHPPTDGYKTNEVKDDPRVTLIPAQHLALETADEGLITAEVISDHGSRRTWKGDAVYLNLGSAPTAPSGDLAHDAAGYCPPTQQHPRLLIAGDLRAGRFQRLMTAMGSGSESALRAYYGTQDLPGTAPW